MRLSGVLAARAAPSGLSHQLSQTLSQHPNDFLSFSQFLHVLSSARFERFFESLFCVVLKVLLYLRNRTESPVHHGLKYDLKL